MKFYAKPGNKGVDLLNAKSLFTLQGKSHLVSEFFLELSECGRVPFCLIPNHMEGHLKK